LEKAPTCQEVEFYEAIEDDLIEEFQPEPEDNSDEEEPALRRRRPQSSHNALEKLQKMRKLKSAINEKVQQYYSQQFFGLPSSHIAYKMIKDLHKLNNSYLWYAMVGLTAMHLEHKVPKEQFALICEAYRVEMSKLNECRASDAQHEKNSLKRKIDFEFPLLRHWSLYKSVLHSPYMIAGLALWDPLGLKKLHELISLIGLSLQEAEQLYKYMLKTSAEKLESSIMTLAGKDKFRLFDIAYESFAKQVDYAFEMTASDYCYALSAVLERPPRATPPIEPSEHRVTCFWEAYSLFEAPQSKLQSAIEESKHELSILTR
jgi:hypothetical protein